MEIVPKEPKILRTVHRVTNEYDACLAKLKMTSECKDDLPIEMHLKALSNTLKKETGAKCNKQGRSGNVPKRSHETNSLEQHTVKHCLHLIPFVN